MKVVGVCVSVMVFWLSATHAAFPKPDDEGSLKGSETQFHAGVKTRCFPSLKAKETRHDWIVKKAVVPPKSVKLGGNGLSALKNNNMIITGTGIHSRY